MWKDAITPGCSGGQFIKQLPTLTCTLISVLVGFLLSDETFESTDPVVLIDCLSACDTSLGVSLVTLETCLSEHLCCLGDLFLVSFNLFDGSFFLSFKPFVLSLTLG